MMNLHAPSRRQFIRTTAVAAGAAVFAPWALNRTASAQAVKRTAIDQVTLGKTGIKLSRLGIGTGVNNGADQVALGKEKFIALIRHAYDQGITYMDCAMRYQTFGWMGEALKGLPREKLFIQSKIWPDDSKDFLATIDSHRKNFNTDYLDTMLIHCRTEANWTDQWKSMMDAYDQAKSKQWIRAKGVSCHSFPALQTAAQSDWNDMHLVRVNPQGTITDGPNGGWPNTVPNPIQPVVDQIKIMHEKGHGVIGMKICGNGFFKDPAEREKSARFSLNNPNIDAIVIGMTSPQQVDDNIAMINRALAA
jgi:predicted aldo/keto reductase-like oxidoreductase